MTELQTTANTTGMVTPLRPAPVDGATFDKMTAEESCVADLSATNNIVTPQPATASTPAREMRSEPRFNVRWHGDVLLDGKNPYPCYVRNISLNGAALFLDQNLQNLQFVELQIYVPPLNPKIKSHIIEAQGKVVGTVFDSHERLFRTSVRFIKFSEESDSAFLQARLSNQ